MLGLIEKGKYIHPELFGKPKSLSISKLTRVPVSENTKPDTKNDIIDLSKLDASKSILK